MPQKRKKTPPTPTTIATTTTRTAVRVCVSQVVERDPQERRTRRRGSRERRSDRRTERRDRAATRGGGSTASSAARRRIGRSDVFARRSSSPSRRPSSREPTGAAPRGRSRPLIGPWSIRSRYSRRPARLDLVEDPRERVRSLLHVLDHRRSRSCPSRPPAASGRRRRSRRGATAASASVEHLRGVGQDRVRVAVRADVHVRRDPAELPGRHPARTGPLRP